MTITLRLKDVRIPLTWDEAQRLSHCQLAWKACKRASVREERAKEDAAWRLGGMKLDILIGWATPTAVIVLGWVIAGAIYLWMRP